MHAVSSAVLSYRGNRPTNTHTNPQTGPITIQCAAKLSAQCNKLFNDTVKPLFLAALNFGV